MVRYRIGCIFCKKGLVRDLDKPHAKEEFASFMVAHMTDFRILAAHRYPISKTVEGSYRPLFTLELAR